MENLSNDHEDHTNQLNYAMKQGILFWVLQKASGNWATWSDFANEGKAIVEQILASEKLNKSKRAGLLRIFLKILLAKMYSLQLQ